MLVFKSLAALALLATATALPNGAPNCTLDKPHHGAEALEETTPALDTYNVSLTKLEQGEGHVFTLVITPKEGHHLKGLLCKNNNADVKGKFTGIPEGLHGASSKTGQEGAECVTHKDGEKALNGTVSIEYTTEAKGEPKFFCVLAEEWNKWWTLSLHE